MGSDDYCEISGAKLAAAQTAMDACKYAVLTEGPLKQVVADTRRAIATHGYPTSAHSASLGGLSWTNTWDLFGEQRTPAQPEKLLRARAASARRHVDGMRQELLRVQEQMVTLQRDIEAEEKDAAIWEAAAEALEQREY